MATERLDRLQRYLKQIVYGGNDGIVTTFAIVAGFAGAQADGVAQIGGIAVLVFGLANLFADGVSMGLGEFLSARSERQLFVGRKHRLDNLRLSEARERLARVFKNKGMVQSDADAASALIARQPKLMSELLLRYEEGLSAPDEDNPATNGLVTFLAFISLGSVPLSPYIVGAAPDVAIRLSVAATFAALLVLGLLRWRATGEPVARSVLEILGVGAACAAVAFLTGLMVGG